MTPWKLGLFVLWNFQWVVLFCNISLGKETRCKRRGDGYLRHQLRPDNNVFWVCAQLLLTHEGPPAWMSFSFSLCKKFVMNEWVRNFLPPLTNFQLQIINLKWLSLSLSLSLSLFVDKVKIRVIFPINFFFCHKVKIEFFFQLSFSFFTR